MLVNMFSPKKKPLHETYKNETIQSSHDELEKAIQPIHKAEIQKFAFVKIPEVVPVEFSWTVRSASTIEKTETCCSLNALLQF